MTSDLENSYFSLKYYECNKCKHIFKVARVVYPTHKETE